MITFKSLCVVHPRSELHDPDFAFEDKCVKLDSEAGSTFCFDRVLGPGTPQDTVYREAAKQAVLDALDEHQPSSAAFVATGAIGSGKTYIVTGGAQHFADRGLIPRGIDTLFEVLNTRDNSFEYQVSVTFFEIHQGRAIDLLEDAGRRPTEVPRRQAVSSAQAAFKLLCQGDGRRQFEERPLSPDSSPSHVVFVLHVKAFGRETCLAFVDISAGDTRAAAKFAASVLDTLPPPEKHIHNPALQEAYLEARSSSAYPVLSQLLRPWLNPGSSGQGFPIPGPGPVKLVFVLALRFAVANKTDIISWLRAASLIEACLVAAQQSVGSINGDHQFSTGLPRPDPLSSLRSHLGPSGPSKLLASEPAVPPVVLHPGVDAGLRAKTNSESGHASATNALKDDLELELVADGELSPLNWWARLLHDLREESVGKKPQDGRDGRMASWADSFSNCKPETQKTVPKAQEKPPPLKLSSIPKAAVEDWEMQASKPSSVRQVSNDKELAPSQSSPAGGTFVPKALGVRPVDNVSLQSNPACETLVPKAPGVRIVEHVSLQSSPACETSVPKGLAARPIENVSLKSSPVRETSAPKVPAALPVENVPVMRAVGNVIPALTCPTCGNPYVKDALFCFGCGQRRVSIRPATTQLSAPAGPASQLRVRSVSPLAARSVSPQPGSAPRIVAGPVLPASPGLCPPVLPATQSIIRAVSPQPARPAPLQSTTMVKYPSWAPPPPAHMAKGPATKMMPVPAPILLQTQHLPSAPAPAMSQCIVAGTRTKVGV